MKLRRISPYAMPDYVPPAGAPEAFKRIVQFMQDKPFEYGAICHMARKLGVSDASFRRYMSFHSGDTALSQSMTETIEEATSNL